jgi:tetratricopeptide (TPR) repeat protein
MKNKKEIAKLDFEIKFYEGILKLRPNFVQALVALGDAYTKRGLFEKGLDIDKRLIRIRPEDTLAWYNLACSYSLVNNVDAGLDALNQAIMLGYEDFSFMEKDKDLDNLKKDSRYQNLFKNSKLKDE